MIKKMIKTSLVAGMLLASAIPAQKAQAFAISSECAVLMEQISGRVLQEKCPDKKMYIASITKILTALVAIENGDLESWVEVDYNVVRQVGSSLYLAQGDQVKLLDLLYGLMLRSGNDAAMAIAQAVGGDEEGFVAMMNDRAREMGLVNSSFQNPSGLDESSFNQSTARDMAVIMQTAMNNPVFREIAGTSLHRATTQNGRTYSWRNKHRLVTGDYEFAIAGKTGFTQRARRTLVTSAQQGDMELVAVTLKAGDDWNDHRNLFEYGFNHFQMKRVLEVGLLSLSVEQQQRYGISERLFIRRDVYLPLNVDGSDVVQTNLQLNDRPAVDEQVGNLQVLLNGEIIETANVYQMPQAGTSGESWFGRLFSRIFGRGDGQ
ncbi:MAG: D-alanyl-D-alanine carboxypeptidase [Turicibacter sp.]|nr:D-alanyl-D-alanine carboxypeptidase [Turicibacter sp.]